MRFEKSAGVSPFVTEWIQVPTMDGGASGVGKVLSVKASSTVLSVDVCCDIAWREE